MIPWRTERTVDLGAVAALPPRTEILAHLRARTFTLASIPGARLETLVYRAHVALRERAGRIVATYDVDVAATARAAAVSLLPLALIVGATCSLALFVRFAAIAATFWLGMLVFAHGAARTAVRTHLRRSIKAARQKHAKRLPAARVLPPDRRR